MLSSLITVQQRVPELMGFIDPLAAQVTNGAHSNWKDFTSLCHAFYTPQRMTALEAQIPGWHKMASYRDGSTLIHVTSALVSLLHLPEYQNATPEQQALMLWIVLLHDLDKERIGTQRDHTHGFRGATVAAHALAHNGFQVELSASTYPTWVTLTRSAQRYSSEHGGMIQDNDHLPQIIAGIDQHCDPHAALIVKGVLLHMSFNVIEAWPNAAPLTDAETQRIVTPTLLPLLRAMTLTDNQAWAFYEPERSAVERQQTLAAWRRIAQLIKT